ncbi:MAG: ParA family chromosome partitioning ATPase [Caulobacteraceae bacterium]|nr:MAG: ParA family chromosome partitioning ATPase [Caulobacteraceae bacterium]
MGRVVAVVNRKGGVGKTTTTVAIADALISELRQNVCVIDLDPQASASIALAGQARTLLKAQSRQDFAGLVQAKMERPDTALESYRIGMVNVIKGRAQFTLDVFNNSDRYWGVESDITQQGQALALKQVIEDLIAEISSRYEYVLLDCPPGESVASSAGLLSADLILCPTVADRLSYWGLQGLGRYIEKVDESLLDRSRFILTRYQERLIEDRQTYSVLSGEKPPEGWPCGDQKPPFPVLTVGSRGGHEDLATIRESKNFVKRLGRVKPGTLNSIYGDATLDIGNAAKAIDRMLSDD